MKRSLAFTIVLITTIMSLSAATPSATGDWAAYGRDPGGQRYSPLTAINRENVKNLKEAWTFRTGDAYKPQYDRATAFEATPLYVDGTIFLSTPLGRVIALDPLTGKERWSYDPKIPKDKGYGDFANRGVSTWVSAKGERRIFVATIDARLVAMDASTGKPCADFGDNGIINLRHGLRIAPRPHGFADYEETSPPAIVRNVIVVGSAIADNGATDQPSGEVRAFDVVTGKQLWSWDPIPQDPQMPGAETWKNGSAQKTGAANAWSIIAADAARNLVFVPTGSPSPDYFGGERLGSNLYANSIVALNAETGQLVWHFQTVHHDLWDYDVASPPLLYDIHQNGKVIPALAVGSKTGHLFILNRETGQPIFGVEEKPVPKTDIPGEVSSPTQPVPILPKPLVKQTFDPSMAWGITDEDRAWCKAEIGKLRNEGIFTPPSLKGTLVVPGNVGGMNWGGAAYDAAHDLLILPASNLMAEVRLVPRDDFAKERTANRNLHGDWEFAPQTGTPFGMARRFMLGPKTHLPCTPPPWGFLTAINASTGEMKWQVTLGQFAGTEQIPGAKSWGSPSLGGPIATAGGVTFIAGTIEAAIRAFDNETGAELWKAVLPTSARSTPMTFQGPDGKQYVLICAGGHDAAGLPLGDYVVAFTLP